MKNHSHENQLSAVMQRRGDLLARIASQREQVTEIGVSFQTPLALAERGLAAARFLRSHPVLVAGVVGVAGMAGVILRVWKGYR